MRSVAPPLLWAVLLAACGGEEEPPAPTEADLEAGTALTDGTGFIEVPEGGDAELVAGAQGGFHVWINVRVLGAAGELSLVREARRTEDGALILAGTEQPIDVPEEAMADWWESPRAVPSFMCPTPIGVGVVGQRVRIEVELLDDAGALLGIDTVTVTPRCPPGPNESWCYDICSG